MRFNLVLFASSLLTTAAAGAIDGTSTGAGAVIDALIVANTNADAAAQPEEQTLLFKRKGGGGGARGGGGGRSGSIPKPGAAGGSPGATRPDGAGVPPPKAIAGGVSRKGSGPQPSYGGGKYYGGGSPTPFASGQRSPTGSIVPLLFVGSALAFWPRPWPGGAYLYPYHDPLNFRNETLTQNQTANVICACGEEAECSCDDNADPKFFDNLIGNGSYAALNKSVIDVALVNGSHTILLNGTLPNGTTARDLNAAAGMRSMLEVLGLWPVGVAVLATVFIA